MGTGTGSGSSNTLLKIGVGLFFLGLVAVIALYAVPAVWSGHTAPVAVYVLAMCTPLGLIIAIAAAVWSGRTPR
ncbi:hypothetical protein [Gordonia araii]|nr:hypothetical protein [Gordonia araii]NNG96473.1 hypothetical protein [Gordonia araii NBRC 100433]